MNEHALKRRSYSEAPQPQEQKFQPNAKQRMPSSAWLMLNMADRRRIFFAVAVVVIIYVLKTFYGWQIMLFQKGYPLKKADRCSFPPSGSVRQHGRHNRPRIGVLMVFDDKMWGSDITRLSVKNKRIYAERHGYQLVLENGSGIDTRRPPAWSKILALKRHLHRFDYLLFMDVDSLVMNMEVLLEDYTGGGELDLIISEDWNGLNTGIFMLRNSTWSHQLLEQVWGSKDSEQEYMAGHESALDGVPYPFEYEQRAFHYVFQTEAWKQRHLPVYDDSALASEGPLWSHLLVLPQCALNSYMLHPLSPHYEVARQWKEGDFIVHMAGHKGATKTALFLHCYEAFKRELKTKQPRSRRLRNVG